MSNGGTGYTPPGSVQELLQRYAEGERRFPDMNLDDENLAGVSLEGALFDDSWCHSVNFEKADLRGASFRRCCLKFANFRGADLRGAVFIAGVEEADFTGALLDGASFAGSSCYGYIVRNGDGFPNG